MKDQDAILTEIREKLKGNNQRAKSFHNFHNFSHFFTLFQNFSPGTFPFKTKGVSAIRTNKREENKIKIIGQMDVAR